MKTFEILDETGGLIGRLEAERVEFISKGADFQPNIFNGYHAVELGEKSPPAVLNLPLGMTIRRI
jgi:hypothetical protein